MHDACGVFGAYLPGEDAARVTFFGIFTLQHRGQESAGIATEDEEGNLHIHTGMGLVASVFDEPSLAPLRGPYAIGHARYSTMGSSMLCNAQPLCAVDLSGETIALAHNGNVVNAAPLRQELEHQGAQFSSTTDSEVIAHLIARAPGKTWDERIRFAMNRLLGAYSLAILVPGALYAVRDPWGFRPLCYGRLNGGWVFASESCALDTIGAQLERDVRPGEVLRIDEQGSHSVQGSEPQERKCLFEYIYFSRPDSVLAGRRVYAARLAMGERLAQEYPVEADIVTAIPESATAAGIGYAHASGIPYVETLVKNRYVGRTFIQPDQRLRDQGVQMKFTALTEMIAGKRIVVVDDSIVRGTTTPHVVGLFRRAGAREVHLRVCAPPIRFPCHFGIDMPSQWELIAATRSVEEVRKAIGADSLGYLSLPSLRAAIGREDTGYCDACFTGNYPVPVQMELGKFALERR
ncbi:MAG: amidophosphoribosyltransferase [Chloroflexi bacterium]|nr:amidophosphoribosyltransferase [Chloroflexota bacterium]